MSVMFWIRIRRSAASYMSQAAASAPLFVGVAGFCAPLSTKHPHDSKKWRQCVVSFRADSQHGRTEGKWRWCWRQRWVELRGPCRQGCNKWPSCDFGNPEVRVVHWRSCNLRLWRRWGQICNWRARRSSYAKQRCVWWMRHCIRRREHPQNWWVWNYFSFGMASC